MGKIVICCRTSDAFGMAGRISDRLIGHFGKDSVILTDLDGSDSAEKLSKAMNSAGGANVLLAVVGRKWLDGIQNEKDPVTSIIGTAQSQNTPTIPVLVNGATMPSAEQLPAAIKNFAFRNGCRVDSAQDFEYHLDRLIRTIEVITQRALAEKDARARKDPLPPARPEPGPVRGTSAVFISHSSRDRKTAETICQAIESRGLRCWISTRDVLGGDDYEGAIVRAIRAAKVMVIVFTENANNSDEIKKELVLASRERLTVIPLRIEDVLPNDALDYQFATRQWIDFFGNWDQAMDTLCKRVSGIVQG